MRLVTTGTATGKRYALMLADADSLLAKIRRHPGRDRSDYQRMMRGWPATRFNAATAELESSKRVSWWWAQMPNLFPEVAARTMRTVNLMKSKVFMLLMIRIPRGVARGPVLFGRIPG
jgi:hypothetical protein